MPFKSKKIAFIILGVTAIVSSRALFFFFDDPEGPNLLVVGVAAAVIYFVSLLAYALGTSTSDSKRFWWALCIQIATACGLYFLGLKF